MDTSKMKMLLIWVVTLLVASAVSFNAVAQTTLPGYREIKWDHLVPKDWDPLKPFRHINPNTLKDGDTKTDALYKKMREVWDNAPTNNQLDGAKVRIPGYVVVLESTDKGVKEFLLVPYFGACIHSPPPPANQIIWVKSQKEIRKLVSMDTVWVQGTLKMQRVNSDMGVSGYQLEAAKVEPYIEPKSR
jgi:uncharacterized protein